MLEDKSQSINQSMRKKSCTGCFGTRTRALGFGADASEPLGRTRLHQPLIVVVAAEVDHPWFLNGRVLGLLLHGRNMAGVRIVEIRLNGEGRLEARKETARRGQKDVTGSSSDEKTT